MKNEIVIYSSKDGQTEIQVQFENETVWLTQKQMAELFNKNIMTISEHIKNIYKEQELEENSTIRKSLIVQKEGNRKVNRKIMLYNLDVIISVGYRVKSKQGTTFRQWATQRLKEHLIQGYTINQKRLEEYSQNIKQLENAVALVKKAQETKNLEANETKGLLEIITKYTHSFILLNQFDSNSLNNNNLNNNIIYEIEYNEAKNAIRELKNQLIAKKEATELFANEKDKSFAGILKSIIQTFDGEYLYQSIEEQAAHLLYFIIKNHPFSDGNKRVGAFLFIWFLEKNKHLLKKSGELKINENGLTALALLVAQSDPNDKELMIQLIVNLIVN